MIITVTEYAELQSYDKTANSGVKKRYVSQETLDWLIDNYQNWSSDDESILTDLKKNSFKLGSYVGYIQSPFNNEKIQILPKIEIGNTSEVESNAILKKMLEVVYDLNARELSFADLDHQQLPLHEWIINQYLNELEKLLQIGLKRDYELVQESQLFIKGRLLMAQQMRKGPGQEAYFDLEHDDFLLNGVENRLVNTALQIVLEITQNDDSLLRSHDFSALLVTIPVSLNPIDELSNWREDRLLASYSGIKPWCEIILTHLRPTFQQGLYRGVALLFSMPHLYEKYVAQQLKNEFGKNLHIHPSQRSFLQHQPIQSKLQDWFRLEPDLAIKLKKNYHIILDTKWKLIHQLKNNSKDKYGISQADLYQMFAYGQKYLNGNGKLILIYPCHEYFNQPLPIFNYSDGLTLLVLPFNLKTGSLIGQHLINQTM
jgi:5-methylcytosine-specific restriction enzyme subunit McrC